MNFSTLTLMQVRDMLISGKVTSAALVEEYTKIVTDDNKSKEPLKGFIELYGDAAEKAASRHSFRRKGQYFCSGQSLYLWK